MTTKVNEITALKQGLPFFIGGGRKVGYHLFIRNADHSSRNSYTGDFDYFWSFPTWKEAFDKGQKLTLPLND